MAIISLVAGPTSLVNGPWGGDQPRHEGVVPAVPCQWIRLTWAVGVGVGVGVVQPTRPPFPCRPVVYLAAETLPARMNTPESVYNAICCTTQTIEPGYEGQRASLPHDLRRRNSCLSSIRSFPLGCISSFGVDYFLSRHTWSTIVSALPGGVTLLALQLHSSPRAVFLAPLPARYRRR